MLYSYASFIHDTYTINNKYCLSIAYYSLSKQIAIAIHSVRYKQHTDTQRIYMYMLAKHYHLYTKIQRTYNCNGDLTKDFFSMYIYKTYMNILTYSIYNHVIC